MNQSIALAFIRGQELLQEPPDNVWLQKNLNELTPTEIEKLWLIAKTRNIKTVMFQKNETENFYDKIIAILKGIQPDNLLEIDAGRGIFLWQLLHHFPFLNVAATTEQQRFYEVIQHVYRGGFPNLKPILTAPQHLNELPNEQFDVVTMVNIFPLKPFNNRLLSELVRVTRRFLVLACAPDELQNLRAALEPFALRDSRVENNGNYKVLIMRK